MYTHSYFAVRFLIDEYGIEKVQNLIYEKPENVVSQYSDLKEQEQSDLYIALTHLGIYDNDMRPLI